LDAGAHFDSDELFISSLRFHALCKGDNADSRVILLLDDVEHIAGAVNGAGFEDQPVVGTNVRGWGNVPTSADDRLNVTGTTYAGSKAANLTLATSGVFGVYQKLCGRPIRGSRNTFLDVVWRLDAYTPSESDFACFYVRFGDGKYLYYYFATSSEDIKHNSTTFGHFNVTGVNTLGTWNLMHRSLSDDYAAVFGSRPDTTLIYLHLYANVSATNRLELLFDDLYLYDIEAPINPWLLLFPIFTAVIVIIIIVVVGLFVWVWRSKQKG
jgi:hypothetical protein